MTWTTFILSLLLMYLSYYVIIYLIDMLTKSRHSNKDVTEDELFFEEYSEPEIITNYQENDYKSEVSRSPLEVVGESLQSLPSVLLKSTGAVDLKQLFNLAKDDLIEYTRAIPY